MGTCYITPKGRRLRWEVGPLTPNSSQTLIVIATTRLNPGGQQEYTSCGDYDFNSGPTAKGYEKDVPLGNSEKKRDQRRTDDGDPILLTVSGADFPECSDCEDNDGDGFIDFPATWDARMQMTTMSSRWGTNSS